jgi:hypothetical protein
MRSLLEIEIKREREEGGGGPKRGALYKVQVGQI